MNKKFIVFFLCAVLMVFGLSGCGDGDSRSGSGQGENAEPSVKDTAELNGFHFSFDGQWIDAGLYQFGMPAGWEITDSADESNRISREITITDPELGTGQSFRITMDKIPADQYEKYEMKEFETYCREDANEPDTPSNKQWIPTGERVAINGASFFHAGYNKGADQLKPVQLYYFQTNIAEYEGEECYFKITAKCTENRDTKDKYEKTFNLIMGSLHLNLGSEFISKKDVSGKNK